MDTFNSIRINQSAELTHVISKKDFNNFVQITGDINKIHTDKEFAKKTKFGKPIVHGMLTASFISTLIGTLLPGDGALWFEQHTKFLLPVFVGEKIRVCGKVKSLQKSLRIIIIDVNVFGEDDRKVIDCKAKVMVIKENE